MEWSDSGIVLSVRPHGETSAVLDLLTRDHGRHAGLVRGGTSRRAKPMLQPGNTLDVQWRGRLEEHLGSFTAEPARMRAGELMARRDALAGLGAFTAMAAATMPEREEHAPVFIAGEILLDAMMASRDWLALYVRWEAGLLEALGFGLDLTECAATGQTHDLAFVSPRTGRAVSSGAGAEYAPRLFRLPPFLLGSAAPGDGDVAAGLALTGHFLLERVLRPHGRDLPAARLRLSALAAHESD